MYARFVWFCFWFITYNDAKSIFACAVAVVAYIEKLGVTRNITSLSVFIMSLMVICGIHFAFCYIIDSCDIMWIQNYPNGAAAV